METEPQTATAHAEHEPNQEQRLITVLYALETQVRRQASLRFAFLRGVVYGFGTVVGATILIAAVSGLLSATFGSLPEVPLIGSFFEGASSDYLEPLP